MISLLFVACMVYGSVFLVLLLSLPWIFPGATVVFSLPMPFLDTHGEISFYYLVELDCRMVSKLSRLVLEKS